MIYDQKSKVFRQFLRALTAEELVMQAVRTFNERQVARFCEQREKEETRMKRHEETHWLSWQEDKPKLYMDAYELQEQRLAQSKNPIDSDQNGST